MLWWLIIVEVLAQSSSEKSAIVFASSAFKTQSLRISRLEPLPFRLLTSRHLTPRLFTSGLLTSRHLTPRLLTSRLLINTSLATAVPLLAGNITSEAELINIMHNASSPLTDSSVLTSSNGTPGDENRSSRWDANTTQLNSESWKLESHHLRRNRDTCNSVMIMNSMHYEAIYTFTEKTATLYFILNEKFISVNVTLKYGIIFQDQETLTFTDKNLCNFTQLHELKVEAFVQNNERFVPNKWGLKLSVDRCYNNTIITNDISRINKFKHIEVSAKGSSKWTSKNRECLNTPSNAATQHPAAGGDHEAIPLWSSAAGDTTTHPPTYSYHYQPGDNSSSVLRNTTRQPSDDQRTHLGVILLLVVTTFIVVVSGILIWIRIMACKHGNELPEEPIYEEVTLMELHEQRGSRHDSVNSIYGIVSQPTTVHGDRD